MRLSASKWQFPWRAHGVPTSNTDKGKVWIHARRGCLIRPRLAMKRTGRWGLFGIGSMADAPIGKGPCHFENEDDFLTKENRQYFSAGERAMILVLWRLVKFLTFKSNRSRCLRRSFALLGNAAHKSRWYAIDLVATDIGNEPSSILVK